MSNQESYRGIDGQDYPFTGLKSDAELFKELGLVVDSKGRLSRSPTEVGVENKGIHNVQIVEEVGTVQKMSDGTYYDSEFGIYYE